jgi:hypothetical protein
MEWKEFHDEFVGKRFVNKLTGRQISRIVVFSKIDNALSMELLKKNTHPLYLVIDAPGWSGGIVDKRHPSWKQE